MIYTLIIESVLLLQSLEAGDLLSLVANKDTTTNGILLLLIVLLWRKLVAAEEKIETIRKEKDAEYQKYVELLVTTNRLVSENNKILDENIKMLARLEKVLDK